MDRFRRLAGELEGYNARQAAAAGAIGSAAYLAEMAVDLPLLRCPSNDLLLLGGIVSRDPRVWPAIGAALHFANGVALAQVYGAVERRLPGPPWVRGVAFTLAENALFWLAVPLLDRYHPAIRAGALPRMNRPIPFLQQVLRHIAYGAALGAVYARGATRAAR